MTFNHSDFTTRPVTPIGDGGGLADAWVFPRPFMSGSPEQRQAGGQDASGRAEPAPAADKPEPDPLDVIWDAHREMSMGLLNLGSLLFMYECTLDHGDGYPDGRNQMNGAGHVTVSTARALVDRLTAAEERAEAASSQLSLQNRKAA